MGQKIGKQLDLDDPKIGGNQKVYFYDINQQKVGLD